MPQSVYRSSERTPTKHKYLDNMPTANSHMFTPSASKMAKIESLPISKIMKKMNLEESNFPEDLLMSPQESSFSPN